MGSNLDDGFAIYPMVEEAEATGVVAGVYAELLRRMPFVPSLFKSLAVCPPYLVLAYEQCATVLDSDALTQRSDHLSASVHDIATPPEQPEVRAALARFVGPLSRMLLLSGGLLLALRGELDTPAAPGNTPPAQTPRPDNPAPSQWDAAAPELYGQIRAALETPLINSIWRQLAADGQLGMAWSALAPQVAGSRAAADTLQRAALDAAVELPWSVAANPAALRAAGIPDAVPGLATILDAYIKTLPRVLVLTSSSAR
jgi:hypothetical protein